MGKFDKYIEEIKAEQDFANEQKRLHEKHDTVEQDKVIIETSNTFKFTLSFLRGMLRVLCTAALFVLAAAGLISLIYPDVRTELLLVISTTFKEVAAMAGV